VKLTFGTCNFRNGGLDGGSDERLRRQLARLAGVQADAWAPWIHTGRLAGQAPAAEALPAVTQVPTLAGNCPKGGDHDPQLHDCQPPDYHCSKCGQYLGPA